MNPFPRAEAGAGHRNGAIRRPRDMDEERAARRAREKEHEMRRRIEEAAMKAAANFPAMLALALGSGATPDSLIPAKQPATGARPGSSREEGNALRIPTAQGAGDPPDAAPQSDDPIRAARANPEADAKNAENGHAAPGPEGPEAIGPSPKGAAAKESTPPPSVTVVASSASSGGDAVAARPDAGSRKDAGAVPQGVGNREGGAPLAQASSSGSAVPSPAAGASPAGGLPRTEGLSGPRPAPEDAAASDPRPTAESGTLFPARSAHRVVLDFSGEDGVEGRLRVALRGDQVRATIVSHDPETARRLESDLSELERALASRGFDQTHLTVQQGRAESARDSSESSHRENPSPQDRGRGGEGTSREDGSQDASSPGLSKQKREKR